MPLKLCLSYQKDASTPEFEMQLFLPMKAPPQNAEKNPAEGFVQKTFYGISVLFYVFPIWFPDKPAQGAYQLQPS